jgi:superoxide reductase
MSEVLQIWKCEICGNIISVLHRGSDSLVCCGENMVLQEENSVDASKEKHAPIIEGKKVKIGSIEHPMGDGHYIEWIEATLENGIISRKFLNPNDLPEVEFCLKVLSARAYCNLHGLWKNQNQKQNQY